MDVQRSVRRRLLLQPRTSVGGVLAILILAACQADGGRAQGDGNIVVTDADVHVVATSDVLARIADVQPTQDGRVWVLNSIEPFFVVVSANGEIERTFGRAGGGPREYGGPVELVAGAGGVWTFDVSRNALRLISSDQARDLRLPPDSFPPSQLVSFGDAGVRPAPPWVRGRGNGFLVGRRRASAPSRGGLGIWEADIVSLQLGPAGVTVTRDTPVADLLGDPAERYGDATVFLPYPIWTVCEDGTLGLYDPLANTLRRIEPDGSEAPAIALAEERREAVTFDRFFEMIYRGLREQALSGQQLPDSLQMRNILEEQFRQGRSTFADVFPEYADLRCTDDGTFWLQPFDVASGRFGHGRAWIRFERNGSRTEVVLPDAFTVHRIQEDRVWGAVVDSLGVPAVAWVPIQG